MTKKIVVVAGMLAFCTGQFEAFGLYNNGDDESGRQHAIATTAVEETGFQDLNYYVIPLIIREGKGGIYPRHLASVCKLWYSIMRENNVPQEELHYSTMNPFMKQCMKTFWASQFYNGVLRYTPPYGGEVIDLKFSDVLSNFEETKGTFDLSSCGVTHNYLRMTLSVEEFLKVRGENENRLGRVDIHFSNKKIAAM